MGQEINHQLIYETLLDLQKSMGNIEANTKTLHNEVLTVKDSHFKLKDDFVKHKSRLLTISALLSTLTGAIIAGVTQWFANKTN